MVLRRAVDIEGGDAALAAKLGIGVARIGLWRMGRIPVPDAVFLQLVDIVLRDDLARSSQDRRQAPRPRSAERADADPPATSAP